MPTLSRLAGPILVLIAALTVPPIGPAAAAPLQQAACTFTAGFQLLHDLIPAVVGNCTENEHFNPVNGNSEQKTTGGLLVWRKADNWTAFTDGGTTWINGPQGVQSRANGDRFPWETAVSGPVASGQPVAPGSPNLGLPPLYTEPTSGAPPSPPSLNPSGGAGPAPAAAPTSGGADQAAGPLTLKPEDALLRLEDMGKQVVQKDRKTGSDSHGSWAEIHFERDSKLLHSHLGPIKSASKVYVANSIADASAIYQQEVGKLSQMPEADKADKFDGTFQLEGITEYGDEQDALSACSPSCNTSKEVLLHNRVVFRDQNAVVVLYFFGAKNSAEPDADQANEWLTKLRERLG
jgi:hypothetical protein